MLPKSAFFVPFSGSQKGLKMGLGLQLGLQMGLQFMQATTPLREKIKAKTAKNGQKHPL
jgi:hypothetical protein